ncbi:MAG: STAS domain-containing protein [Planctomycetes bacterium]|nr:STAS domain-containing protein [Planctomycetota bacterium]
MPAPVKFSVREEPGTVIVTVTGDLSLSAVDEFQVYINGVAAKKPRLAIFEMHEVTFVSSLAMGSLVSLYHVVNKVSGGKVVLVGLQSMIRRAFEVAKLNELIGLAESVEDAVKKYG